MPTDRAVAGQSAGRRRGGLSAHYTLLVVLALFVLLPILLVFILTLSFPPRFITAGTPLHPVAVEWTDRTWFSGGAASLLARSAILLFVLAWLQLRAAGGRLGNLAPLRNPRRVVAVLVGFVAICLLSGRVIASLVDRSPETTAWFLGSMAVVAATQMIGYADPDVRPSRLAAQVVGVGLAMVAFAGTVMLAVLAVLTPLGLTPTPAWYVGAIGLAATAVLIVAAESQHSLLRPMVWSALTGVALVTAVVVTLGAAVWGHAWNAVNLGPAMQRSAVVTLLIVMCQVVTSVLAAYAFAFLRFPGKGLAFGFFMSTMLLPIEVTLLANVHFIRQLGWVNSTQALVLPFAAVAFGTFLIRQGFRGIPPEVRDAARLDGYGHLSFMLRFAVPLTRPLIAAFILVATLAAWSQYLWPQAVIDDRTDGGTAQIALRTATLLDPPNANRGIAAALIVSLPVIVLLFAFQRHIIRGLTAGAVK